MDLRVKTLHFTKIYKKTTSLQGIKNNQIKLWQFCSGELVVQNKIKIFLLPPNEGGL